MAGLTERYWIFRRVAGPLFSLPRIFSPEGRSKQGQERPARWPFHNKEDTMPPVQAPQKLDPQDIVKLLVALRRALNAAPSSPFQQA